MSQWRSKKTDELFDAVLALKNRDEARRFLRDLLTEQEIIEFGNRWAAARMLNKKVPYKKIESRTGLSSTTIARISMWLKKGMGGYRLMISRLATHHNPLPSGKGLR